MKHCVVYHHNNQHPDIKLWIGKCDLKLLQRVVSIFVAAIS